MTIDKNNNIYILGANSNSQLIFGKDTILDIYPNIPISFIVKYDSSGNVLWTCKAGGPGWQFNTTEGNGIALSGDSLAVQSEGEIYRMRYIYQNIVPTGLFKLHFVILPTF